MTNRGERRSALRARVAALAGELGAQVVAAFKTKAVCETVTPTAAAAAAADNPDAGRKEQERHNQPVREGEASLAESRAVGTGRRRRGTPGGADAQLLPRPSAVEAERVYHAACRVRRRVGEMVEVDRGVAGGGLRFRPPLANHHVAVVAFVTYSDAAGAGLEGELHGPDTRASIKVATGKAAIRAYPKAPGPQRRVRAGDNQAQDRGERQLVPPEHQEGNNGAEAGNDRGAPEPTRVDAAGPVDLPRIRRHRKRPG